MIYFGSHAKVQIIICSNVDAIICEQLVIFGFGVILCFKLQDMINEIDKFQTKEITLYGRGCGAELVSHVAIIRKVKAVIVESPLASPYDSANNFMTKILPVPTVVRTLILLFFRQYDIEQNLKKQHSPVLIIFGKTLYPHTKFSYQVSFAQKEELAQTIYKWLKLFSQQQRHGTIKTRRVQCIK